MLSRFLVESSASVEARRHAAYPQDVLEGQAAKFLGKLARTVSRIEDGTACAERVMHTTTMASCMHFGSGCLALMPEQEFLQGNNVPTTHKAKAQFVICCALYSPASRGYEFRSCAER